MRILTVRQPWAWAIIHGGKDVENRSRNIAGDYRGLVAIHAGLAIDNDADAIPPVRGITVDQWYNHAARHRGHIIGVVDLVGVHEAYSCQVDADVDDRGPDSAWCSRWATKAHHHLEFANPRPLTNPIPHKGGLGLRHVDTDLEARIWAEVAS